MAIIACPNCGKNISSKATECSYCQLELKNLDPDKLKRIKQQNNIKKSQSLMNHSFIAMLLFCGGFLLLFWRDAAPGSVEYIIAMASAIIGCILYLVTRVRIILLKKKSK